MHVYSCHIQSQLVTRAARSGNFKNYSPHGCARLIERANFPFYPRVSSSAAFFPINASTFFPLFPLYAYFIIFFPFGLQQTRHRDLHFSNSSRFSTFACALVLYRLASSRYRLTISFLEQPTCVRRWVATGQSQKSAGIYSSRSSSRLVVRFRSVIFATIITKFLNFNVIIEGI